MVVSSINQATFVGRKPMDWLVALRRSNVESEVFNWETSIIFSSLSLGEGTQEVPQRIVFILTLGAVGAIRIPTAEDLEATPYIIAGEPVTWKLLLNGSLTVAEALTQQKLVLRRGDPAILLEHTFMLQTLIDAAFHILQTSSQGGEKRFSLSSLSGRMRLTRLESITEPKAVLGEVAEWQTWSKFRLWRRTRPFAGSILLILSGILVLWGPVSLLQFSFLPGSPIWAGVLVGALLVVMGLIQLLSPAHAVITGSVGVVLALISLLVALGGFGIGMLFGLVGGALGVAWRPVRASKIVEPTVQIDRKSAV